MENSNETAAQPTMRLVEMVGPHVQPGRRGRIVSDRPDLGIIIIELFPTPDDPKPVPLGYGRSSAVYREITDAR